MTPQSLTIVMPVYNEAATLRTALERLLAVDLPVEREIVIVDDGSTDGCMALIQDLVDADDSIRTFRQEPNQGKGAALQRGFAEATGDLLTILDADLEYDPADFVAMLHPVLHEDARVVYGTRSFGSNAAYSFWYVMGNKLVAFWASLLYNAWLSDVETCLKLAPTELWRDIEFKASGLRHRGRGDRRPPAAGRAHLRGADQLQGPQPGRGQEDHLARRRRRPVDPPADPAAGAMSVGDDRRAEEARQPMSRQAKRRQQ